MAAAIIGMERVSVLIGRCAIYEQLYLSGDVTKDAEEATADLRRGLLTLYTSILQALCRLIKIFHGRTPPPGLQPLYMCTLARLILSTRKID